MLNKIRNLARVNYHYTGRPVGANTSGNYGDMPRPAPLFYSVTQGPVDAVLLSVAGLLTLVTCSACFGPVFLAPFWIPHKRALRDAADKYGPTRYGKGSADIA